MNNGKKLWKAVIQKIPAHYAPIQAKDTQTKSEVPKQIPTVTQTNLFEWYQSNVKANTAPKTEYEAYYAFFSQIRPLWPSKSATWHHVGFPRPPQVWSLQKALIP